jgi:hypothetical protein
MEVSSQLHASAALFLAKELTIEQKARLAQALGALWWLKKNPYLCWESNLGRY